MRPDFSIGKADGSTNDTSTDQLTRAVTISLVDLKGTCSSSMPADCFSISAARCREFRHRQKQSSAGPDSLSPLQ